MSEESSKNLGVAGWIDLTVPDASPVRDFYQRVVGWSADAHEMGGYADYVMKAPGSGAPVAGVCHARGVNEALPPVWLIYWTVEDLERSIAEVLAAGGEVVRPAASAGGGRFCVIRDPAGALCALYQG